MTTILASTKPQYSTSVDVRELGKNIDLYTGQKLRYTGEVLSIFTDANDGAQLQVTVPVVSGQSQTLVIMYSDVHAGDGIYEGDTVTVWLRPVKAITFKNGFGAEISQPGCVGDFIEKQ